MSGLLADMPWQAWMWLARTHRSLDTAAALAHAAGCPACQARIAEIRIETARAARARLELVS